tara:strand:+ start:166 stop:600 length:435 start_codon:yes stop_codon:yes gene_type:complete
VSKSKHPRNRKRTGLAILLIGGSAIVTFLFIISSDRNMQFDAKSWRQNSYVLSGSDLRQRMSRDLERNVLVGGMTRTEVESLLGIGESWPYSDDFDLAYRLGTQPSSGTVTRHGSVISAGGGTKWFVLKFNEQDRLIDWRTLGF